MTQKETDEWNRVNYINLLKKQYAEKCYDYHLVMNNKFNKISKIF